MTTAGNLSVEIRYQKLRITFNFCFKQGTFSESSLYNAFFINITKDLQCIQPPKMCMKCYLVMNTAWKRNSTISLKTYEKWCSLDNHSCRMCVRVTELNQGVLGKIRNTSKNDRRVRPSLSKLFWSQEDLDILSAKCPPDSLPTDTETSYFNEKWNPHLSICMCNICNNLLRRPAVLRPWEHAFRFICIAKKLRGQDKNSAKCFKCSSHINEITNTGCMKN